MTILCLAVFRLFTCKPNYKLKPFADSSRDRNKLVFACKITFLVITKHSTERKCDGAAIHATDRGGFDTNIELCEVVHSYA